MTRFKMAKQSKGVWDIVKAQDGPWMLFEDHERVTAEQRQEIARLREAIETLYGSQNGCPLPKYEAAGLFALYAAGRAPAPPR